MKTNEVDSVMTIHTQVKPIQLFGGHIVWINFPANDYNGYYSYINIKTKTNASGKGLYIKNTNKQRQNFPTLDDTYYVRKIYCNVVGLKRNPGNLNGSNYEAFSIEIPFKDNIESQTSLGYVYFNVPYRLFFEKSLSSYEITIQPSFLMTYLLKGILVDYFDCHTLIMFNLTRDRAVYDISSLIGNNHNPCLHNQSD